MEGLAAYALRASGALPGDVMIIGSVSGKTMNVIDLAIEAKKFGLKIIALTSMAYSAQVKSEHSSGKRLFECADIVLDNCASRSGSDDRCGRTSRQIRGGLRSGGGIYYVERQQRCDRRAAECRHYAFRL